MTSPDFQKTDRITNKKAANDLSLELSESKLGSPKFRRKSSITNAGLTELRK